MQHDVRWWLSVHDTQVVFQFDLQLLSVHIFFVRAEIRMFGLGRLHHSRCGSRRASTNCLKVLNRHFPECQSALSWHSARTPGGGWPPHQEECLCLTIHICHSTALVVFSLYTRRDIDSDDSHAHQLIYVCAQPIVWFEREIKLRAGHRADTRQTE